MYTYLTKTSTYAISALCMSPLGFHERVSWVIEGSVMRADFTFMPGDCLFRVRLNLDSDIPRAQILATWRGVP